MLELPVLEAFMPTLQHIGTIEIPAKKRQDSSAGPCGSTGRSSLSSDIGDPLVIVFKASRPLEVRPVLLGALKRAASVSAAVAVTVAVVVAVVVIVAMAATDFGVERGMSGTRIRA